MGGGVAFCGMSPLTSTFTFKSDTRFVRCESGKIS